MTIADKLTLLASSKEALRVKLGLPESLPLSEYYKLAIRKPFDPSDLFVGGKQGVWYDPSDKSTLFQDVAGTIPVTKDGDPIALMKDKSGNDYHATQSVSAARPTYRTDGILHWLKFDGADDYLTTNYTTTANWSSYVGLVIRAARGFVFESLGGGASVIIDSNSSAPKIMVYSAPVGYEYVETYTFSNPLAYSARILGDGVASAVVIGARLSGGTSSFNASVNMYSLIMLNEYASDDAHQKAQSYTKTKAGVTL